MGWNDHCIDPADYCEDCRKLIRPGAVLYEWGNKLICIDCVEKHRDEDEARADAER